MLRRSWDRAQTQGRVAVNSCWIVGRVTEALELLYQEENLAAVFIWVPIRGIFPPPPEHPSTSTPISDHTPWETPDQTLTLLSVIVCCSQIVSSSMFGLCERNLK